MHKAHHIYTLNMSVNRQDFSLFVHLVKTNHQILYTKKVSHPLVHFLKYVQSFDEYYPPIQFTVTTMTIIHPLIL